MKHPEKLPRRTSELKERCRDALTSAGDPFEASRKIVRHLGATASAGAVDFGFWIPSSETDQPLWLELMVPLDEIGAEPDQTVCFHRRLIELEREGEFAWAAVGNLPLGARGGWGAFYWVRRGGHEGRVWHDFMAASLPFGSFGPAEVYDWTGVQAGSASREVGAAAGPPRRLPPPSNILEIHVQTASAAGTLAALTEIFGNIADKLRTGRPLQPWEKAFHGYEAVELLPLEPVAEPRVEPFWRVLEGAVKSPNRGSARALRPKISNWGYDTLIAGFAAVNPALLSQGRPHELADLAACLRDHPGGPIRLVFDVVLGHAHSQAEKLLNPSFFSGSSPYGKSLDYGNPMVRAILLEMLRRKLNWGADGIRVDASQDVRLPGTGPEGPQDEAFLDRIADTVIETAGRRYRPFVIFEDGRPWPRPDWKLTATCLDVRRRQPHALQWSPWTFSSNIPLDPTYWISRKWRLDETARHGDGWVTGCWNHDTLRRGAASPPALTGAPDPTKFSEAYDNPAALLLCHCFLPGVPMDFLQASLRAPWTFFRNCDAQPLRTVCGELGAVAWLTHTAEYRRKGAFPRLKALGLPTLERLVDFARRLRWAARLADFDETLTAEILGRANTVPIAPEAFCRAWMSDMLDHCNVQARLPRIDPRSAEFRWRLRDFRLRHPWLRDNLRKGDTSEHRPDLREEGVREGGDTSVREEVGDTSEHDNPRKGDTSEHRPRCRPDRREGDRFEHLPRFPGAVVYRGRRTSPTGEREIQLVVNLAGEEAVLAEEERPSAEDGWQLELACPGLEPQGGETGRRLEAGQGALWTRSGG